MKDTFTLSGQYRELFERHNIDIAAALRKAQLPEDLFAHKVPTLTTKAYFDFLEAVSRQLVSEQQVIEIGSSDHIEMFSPPIFAAYSSRDGQQCLERLAAYKRLVCPIDFVLADAGQETSLRIALTTKDEMLPALLVQSEFVFITAILRRATKEAIVPLSVTMRPKVESDAFAHFFGCPVSEGEENKICFQNADLRLPFISRNDAMWDFLAPELQRRLSEMNRDSSYQERVRAALVEILPRGESSITAVAEKLALSTRTLQRLLKTEKTTFQKVLSDTRLLLVKEYLKDDTLTSADFAYLLGYQDISTFLRAFHQWTGKTLTQYKSSLSSQKES